MIRNYSNFTDLSFEPSSESINSKNLRIMSIEGMTGLQNIEIAFKNPLNNTEVELLASFLDRKYDLSLGDTDILSFVTNILGFSLRSLQFIHADFEEFYDNLTTIEAIEIILTKLLDNNGDIPSTNGFPAEFNFNSSNANIVQNYENSKWFPYTNSRYLRNKDQLLIKIMQNINIDNSRLFFHGCSWAGGLGISNGLEIRPRPDATDFGLRNFYVTDTFQTAWIWAIRNRQPAISIFVIPEEFIDNLEHHIILHNDNTWKNLVFRCRNRPSNGPNLRNRLIEYNNFIRELDSNDLISGPIFVNPGVRTVNDVNPIIYGNNIPYQYSFKDSTLNNLNGMLAITVFFQEG